MQNDGPLDIHPDNSRHRAFAAAACNHTSPGQAASRSYEDKSHSWPWAQSAACAVQVVPWNQTPRQQMRCRPSSKPWQQHRNPCWHHPKIVGACGEEDFRVADSSSDLSYRFMNISSRFNRTFPTTVNAASSSGFIPAGKGPSGSVAINLAAAASF